MKSNLFLLTLCCTFFLAACGNKSARGPRPGNVDADAGGPGSGISAGGPGSPFDPNRNATNMEGSETQNGGSGVKLSANAIYSLDLYLRNAHLKPYLSESVVVNLSESEKAIVERHLSRIVTSPAVTAIVVRKLAEFRVRLEETKMAYSVSFAISNMDNYTWSKLPGSNCLSVNDDKSPLPNKVQLAYREGRYIRFCEGYGSLDAGNQAALIVHEILYATLTRKNWVVELTGFLFSEDYARWDTHAKNEMWDLMNAIEPDIKPDGKVHFVSEVGRFLNLESAVFANVTNQRELCFGKGYRARDVASKTNRELSPLVWTVAKGSSCESGVISSTGTLALAPSGSEGMYGNMAVAKMDEQNRDIIEFCDGTYTALCELSFSVEKGLSLKMLLESPTIETAIEKKNQARFEYLAKFVDVQMKGEQLLDLALKSENAPVVIWLVEHGVDVSRRLFEAIRLGNANDAALLFQAKDLNVNSWHCVLIGNRVDYWTLSASCDNRIQLIHLAAAYQRTWAISEIKKRGGNMNSILDSHGSPLHIAVSTGSSPTVAALLKVGADVNLNTPKQAQVVQYVVSSSDLQMIRMVVDAGAARENVLAALEQARRDGRGAEIIQFLESAVNR